MSLDGSVIICSHNPRREYLSAVLAALKAQAFPLDRWELLLVDNASRTPLASEWELSWHPNARHVRENEVGLTPARLRGIRESRADTIIFVDDDNVLDGGYLAEALRIAETFPFIGAWGGQARPRFEVEPAEWTKPYWHMLGVGELEKDRWSNLPNQFEATPCGAGMCVRRSVALAYVHAASTNPLRMLLGRRGNALTSCEDSDLAFTACDLGLGVGRFARLRLTHLIPAARLDEGYLVRLTEGLAYSTTILLAIRGKVPQRRSAKQRLLEALDCLSARWRTRKFMRARRRGIRAGLRALSDSRTAQNCLSTSEDVGRL